ncbi:unnamed protein product [Hydatigera taeniaeformis]|uniref:Nucleoporin NUP42 n=1 Tax=Hydatigena taeniaeformis TaxID=6205 RepID=A0A0R3WLS9_HYDTA|nr:unnamed protein product [Hydatigera taeniaeformis]
MYSAICHHYLAGYCRNGDDCIFIHADPAYKPRSPYTYSAPHYERSFLRNFGSPRVCRFYQMGYCAYGAGCEFLHPRDKALNTSQQPPRDPNIQRQVPTSKSDRFHYRKTVDAEPTPTTFSFKKTLESLLLRDTASAAFAKREDFGYKREEVFSAKENLSDEDLKIYSETGESGFSSIPLLPPPEDLCQS